MCQEADPRFGMSIRESFSKSIALTVIKEYDKCGVTQITTVLQCFFTFTMLLVKGSSETLLFRQLFDYVFGLRNFLNAGAMSVILFSKRSKLNLDFKNESRNSEKVFFF